MTDEKIIQLYFDREEAAIEATDKKYGKYCRQIAVRILNNNEDAEECLNDAWMRVWNAIPPNHPTNFRLYLGAIIRNIAFTKYRKKTSEKRGSGEIALVLDELQECLAGKEDVEDICIAEELQVEINSFIRSLPEREGNIMIRRYFFLDSVKDISKRYKIPGNTVRTILFRERNQLREHLEKKGYLL